MHASPAGRRKDLCSSLSPLREKKQASNQASKHASTHARLACLPHLVLKGRFRDVNGQQGCRNRTPVVFNLPPFESGALPRRVFIHRRVHCSRAIGTCCLVSVSVSIPIIHISLAHCGQRRTKPNQTKPNQKNPECDLGNRHAQCSNGRVKKKKRAVVSSPLCQYATPLLTIND